MRIDFLTELTQMAITMKIRVVTMSFQILEESGRKSNYFILFVKVYILYQVAVG